MTKEVETKSSSLPAVLGQNNVPTMLEMVKKQINAIKGNLPPQSHTTSELPGFGKINQIKTVDLLIKAASMVIGKSNMYNEAAKEIIPVGIKAPAYKLEGSTKEQWLSDIKARVAIVANKTQLDKLNKIRTTLEDSLSEEARIANNLDKVRNLLLESEDE